MKIDEVSLKLIPDSRGDQTLQAEMRLGNLTAVYSVPNGKSRGSHEAFVLAPDTALGKFEELKPKILAEDFRDQISFDYFLISEDGTLEKSNLGGNLILALSCVWARLKAKQKGKELFEYLREIGEIAGQSGGFPRLILNVIEGGAHVHPDASGQIKNKLEFQEYQIIPDSKIPEEALELGIEFYKKLGDFLSDKYGKENLSLGDEAGFSAPFENNEEPLEILSNLIAQNNYPLKIGLDVAANQYFKNNVYVLAGKNYSAEELGDLYAVLASRYKIISLEDPFEEDAFDDFRKLEEMFEKKSEGGVGGAPIIITDDLTTTNEKRLDVAVQKKSGKAIIIKPNQIGTITETLKVAKKAKSAGWEIIVSHRSGETNDDFIADLAVALGAWGLKSGAPAKPERLVKYERLIKLGSAN